MSIVIIAPKRDVSGWIEEIKKIDKDIEIEVWPNVNNPDKVECAIVWNHPEGALREYKNLKFISSMGAGIDHLLKDNHLPGGVPITRIVDDILTTTMSNYIIAAIMFFHRRLSKYIVDKNNREWDQASNPEVELNIGIMGMGVMGKDVARKLTHLSFRVYGFSKTPKQVEDVECFSGENEINDFLKKINVLVCLLPLTSETTGLLDISLFERMNRGSYLINAARGEHLVEEDLLEALGKGYLSAAFLDVYRQEPLPEDHPFWAHPNIMMTPHIASITNPSAAIPQIIKNYKRMKEEKPLLNQVDPNKEY